MLDRRKFIKGAVSAAALSWGEKARASSGVIAGAIRWDAWYYNTGAAATSQANLGPPAYQYRAPWFCTQHLAQSVIDCAGDKQLAVDLEIQWAAAAGLKFWAFDQYAVPGPNAGQMNAWQFYQQSAFNSQINWCMLAVSDSLFGSTGNFSTQVAQYVAWFQQSNYQKVLTNRPLLFMFGFNTLASFGGSTSNFAAMISALRTATTGAGLGTPYIVWMDFSPSNAATFMTAIGADAISSYAYFATSPGQSYASLAAGNQSLWTSMKGTGAALIPNCQMGADTRPRGGTNWAVPATPAERAALLQAGVNFVQNNPVACASAAMIIYSWTECDEGGGALIPTSGDVPLGLPPTLSRVLSAIAPVIM